MNEFEKIGPELSKIKKDNGFKVPENYFDNFSDRLHDRIHAEPEKSLFYKLFHQYKPQLIYALSFASFILIVFVSYKLFFKNPEVESSFQSEIAELIEEEIYYYNEQTIIEAFEENTINDESLEVNSSDEILEYLINDDIDMSSIIDEL